MSFRLNEVGNVRSQKYASAMTDVALLRRLSVILRHTKADGAAMIDISSRSLQRRDV